MPDLFLVNNLLARILQEPPNTICHLEVNPGKTCFKIEHSRTKIFEKFGELFFFWFLLKRLFSDLPDPVFRICYGLTRGSNRSVTILSTMQADMVGSTT